MEQLTKRWKSFELEKKWEKIFCVTHQTINLITTIKKADQMS